MKVKVEGMRNDGSRLTITKRVFLLRNAVSVVERLKFTCAIWGGFAKKEGEKDSHQR